MREQRDQITGAIFFVESDEERLRRQMQEEYPLLKKALLLLLKKYQGPLPEDVKKFVEEGLHVTHTTRH